MHDPKTVAFDIYLGRKEKKNGHYRSPFITIWHNDPETDGTDDSAGWFIRPRHCNQKVLEKIQKEFLFNYEHKYWFDANGESIFSTSGTLLLMYKSALWIHFKCDRGKLNRFMQKNLHKILDFAENPIDCIGDTITNKWGLKYGERINEEKIKGLAGTIYADIMRTLRPWYKHPRWHIQHWSIQFHPLQNLKRRYWDKCCVCGKRGFKSSAHGDWSGTKIWHSECDTSRKPPVLSEKD